MTRLKVFRDCLLFFAIGMAFGCCGCLKAPHAETVELSEVSGLLNAPPMEHTVPVDSEKTPEVAEAEPEPETATEAVIETTLVRPVATPQPIYTPQTFETLKPATVEAPRPERKKFTGALVYVAEECPPCHYLETDLRYLQAHYHWTLTDERTEKPADFVLSTRPSPSGQNPFIEYYRDGEIVATAQGYSNQPAFVDRKAALRQILSAHPLSGRELKQ
jgi:hypothetical protein